MTPSADMVPPSDNNADTTADADAVASSTPKPESAQPVSTPAAPTPTSQPREQQPREQLRPPEKQFTPSALKRSVRLKRGPPGGFDPTPLPDAPQGYTVRFGFRCAANLPPADFSTASSDPYLTATLKASNPRRHKEEPDLVYRTKTLRRTLEPEWNDFWTVANVPPSGFSLKCRLYDEDSRDGDDRLGNVTVKVASLFDGWTGFPPPGREFAAQKRMISKRAYLLKGLASLLQHDAHMTPRLTISVELLGPSEPPHAQMYTLAPTSWIKHYSPMIGRIAGTKVNADENDDETDGSRRGGEPKSQKYDFQASEMQLQGPVPPRLYHRYVEFRPIIASMFSSTGLRGKILNMALHKQHERIYAFDETTERGLFEARSEQATQQFLRLVHFDEGARLFTYVLTLDGLLRFTETGKEFGIDLLSKHTMHSDVATYIACSGKFFVRRLERPDASEDPEPAEKVHPTDAVAGGPPKEAPPRNPRFYQLPIDNDSGTYRPDKSVLPDLKAFLEANLPGLGIVTMHCEDEELQRLKEAQRNFKKREGRVVNLVMNRSRSGSFSSAESELDRRNGAGEGNQARQSKREALLSAVEDPSKIREAVGSMVPRRSKGVDDKEGMEEGESSKAKSKA